MPDFVLNVQYENLISNTKKEVNKILEFCNLPWEDNCLEFYKTKRAIKTVSSAQARKPIYKSSIQSLQKLRKIFKRIFI